MNNDNSDSYSSTVAKVHKKTELEVLSGPMDGSVYKIVEDSVIIGREKDQDIALPLDILVSRTHARLTFKDGKHWLKDLGSMNGTMLDGKLLTEETVLPPGSIFKIGLSEMRLMNHADMKDEP